MPSSQGAPRRVVGGRGVPSVKNPVGPNLVCGLRAGRIDATKDESVESEAVTEYLRSCGQQLPADAGLFQKPDFPGPCRIAY
jgi:hypothetical protein